VSVYNVIIARTFIQSNIPNELREAASIDGCDDFKFFFKVVLPLSKAVIAVLCIFYAVGHWNSYFNALIYLNSREKFPLQLFLREILVRNEAMSDMNIYQDQEGSEAYIMLSMSMRYSLIILASIPVLMLYPFMQKHFMKGVMVGAIKG
jgi:multiple sugar transport system permease protein/putative aldouronate transport system permease protein